jgi:hypothetical protein
MSKKSKEIELKYSTPENTPVSKKGYFVTPLDSGWVSERNNVDSEAASAVTGAPILAAVGSFFTFAISTFFTSGEALGLIWGASAAGVVAVGSISTFLIPAIFRGKKNNKAMDYAIEVNARFIQDWLLKKYNLSIDSANANLLSAWTSGLNHGHKNQNFTDSKGNKYKLDYIVVDGINEFFVVPVSVDDTSALKPQNDVLTLDVATTVNTTESETASQQETVFTDEAATLYSSIVTRVQKLNSMNVSVEKQHTIEFITKELSDVIQLHQKALLLTDDKKTLPRVISVLSNLNDELDKLILAELADVETQLLVKENHLNSRKQENIEPIRAIESLTEEERANV